MPGRRSPHRHVLSVCHQDGSAEVRFPSESDSESEDSCSQAYEDVIDSRGAQKQSTASAMTSRTTGPTSFVGTQTQASARIPLVDAWLDLRHSSAKPHFVCDATAALPERCISSGSALRICSALHTCAMHFHALQTLQCTLRDAMAARASLRYGCHRSIILHSVRHCKPRIDKYK